MPERCRAPTASAGRIRGTGGRSCSPRPTAKASPLSAARAIHATPPGGGRYRRRAAGIRLCSFQLQRLHPLDVVIAVVRHGIRYLAGEERRLQVDDGVLDRAAGDETEIAPDLLRGDVVGAMIVARRDDDVDLLPDFLT